MEISSEDAKWVIGLVWGALSAALLRIWHLVTSRMTKLENRVERFEDDLSKHILHVTTYYPTKQETRESFAEIKAIQEKTNDKLDKIIEQLGRKVDRQ
jgi:predicted nucleic acid-binding protein